jgi:Glycosyl hydrolase family 76
LSTDQQEAAASYQALQQNLYEAPTLLYQGLPSNPCDPYSCLWPFTNAMAGTVYLAAGPGGRGYTTDVLARTLGLLSYADLHETSPTGTSQTPAFQSAVAPPRGPGGNTYYDDNAWAALDLIAAYRLTGSNIDLFVAQALFNFVLTGWDTSRTDGCPGGVFWEDVSGSQRNTTANAANAEVGLELYQLTKNVTDLFGAAVMYQWVNTCLKSPDDLYYDHVNPGGTVNTTIWSYNQGTMVGAGVLLYQITGNAGFLTSAQATAEAAVAYVFHLSGPLARDIAVVVDGRARVVEEVPVANVEIWTDTLTFIQLACGRIDAQEPIDLGTIHWRGDAEIGERAARNLRFTM